VAPDLAVAALVGPAEPVDDGDALDAPESADAEAMLEAIAVPTPSATAKAPTRPTHTAAAPIHLL